MYDHCKKDSTLRKPDISGCLVVLFSIQYTDSTGILYGTAHIASENEFDDLVE
jgi:hypothetical protein